MSEQNVEKEVRRMSTTTVALTFANRHYDPEVIELVHAWDIDGVEENPSGYEDTKREALASLGSDLLRWVTVEVNVPDSAIRQALCGSLPPVASSEPVVTAILSSATPDTERPTEGEVG